MKKFYSIITITILCLLAASLLAFTVNAQQTDSSANVPWQFSAHRATRQRNRTKQQPNTMGFQNKWRRLVFPCGSGWNCVCWSFDRYLYAVNVIRRLQSLEFQNWLGQSSRCRSGKQRGLHWQRRPQHLCFETPKAAA